MATAEYRRAAQQGGAIVVGTTGDAGSTATVEWAGAEAARRGAAVRLIRTVGYTPVTVDAMAWAGWAVGDEIDEARAVMAATVASVRSAHPHLDVTGQVIVGEQATVLADNAKHAQLVVISGGGRPGGLSSMCRSRLLTRSRAPVVTVATGSHLADTARSGSGERVAIVVRSQEGARDCLQWVSARARRGGVTVNVRLVLGRAYADESCRMAAQEWLFDALAGQRRRCPPSTRFTGAVLGPGRPAAETGAWDLLVTSVRWRRLVRRLSRVHGPAPAAATAVLPAG